MQPKETWSLDSDLADRLQARLSQVKPTRESVWKAYAFSRLSIQTALKQHEASYVALMKIAPTPEKALALDSEEIALAIKKARVPFYMMKGADLHRAAELMSDALRALDQHNPQKVRRDLVRLLPGLSYAKVSFMLMLLGRMEFCCLDVHMVRDLGLKSRPATEKQYRLAEARVRRRAPGFPLGVAQWIRWMDGRGEGLGHEVYFSSLGLSE